MPWRRLAAGERAWPNSRTSSFTGNFDEPSNLNQPGLAAPSLRMSSAEGTADFPGGGDFPGEELRAGKLDNQAHASIQPRPMYELLNTINDPADLRKLERRQLKQLADELRTFVLHSVSQTG